VADASTQRKGKKCMMGDKMKLEISVLKCPQLDLGFRIRLLMQTLSTFL
jgi:hypothetical protein